MTAHLLIEVCRHEIAHGLQYGQESEQRNSAPGFPALCALQLHPYHHGAWLVHTSAGASYLQCQIS